MLLTGTYTPRLRQVMIGKDQGIMNIEPQMSVQLTLCCYHSTIYVRQCLMSRLQFFEAFVTIALQFHIYKVNRYVKSDLSLLCPCKTTPWLICWFKEESLVFAVDQW